jgi:hypothetical protein
MRALKPTLFFSLMLGLLLGSIPAQTLLPAWADVVHFSDGQVVRGKLNRVTGDLIDFKRRGEFFLLSNQEIIQRIRLTNRHDIVELRNSQKYFGEIVYVDKFKIELKTATGNLKINRLKVTNIILGSPSNTPTPDFHPAAYAPGE